MVGNHWRQPTSAAVAVATLLALAVTAQPMPPPPTAAPPTQAPPPPGAGSTGSGYQMDFGSDGSAIDEGSGSTWQPMPTASSDSSNMDWSWYYGNQGSPDASSSSSVDSSASGSEDAGWADYGEGPGVEIVFPGHDGSIEAIARRVYEFDKSQGFRLLANYGGQVYPGNCYYEYCVHIVFESDYGAMSPFDAFVLDRYESATGPVTVGYDEWNGRGPMPLVLGRMSDETRSRLQGGDWARDVFNWYEYRRTMWRIHPKEYRYDMYREDGTVYTNNSDPREIDLTLSLKQLYTLLPGYREAAANNASDGPFYSADPTDQLIIRISAALPSPFTSASAMLPMVVNHTGSQLVDINLTSTMLFRDSGMTGSNIQDGVRGSNEIQLTIKLSRRKHGGIMPWFPAKLSYQCEWAALYNPLPDAFKRCLDAQLQRWYVVLEDLLSWRNDRTWLNITEAAETCISAIASGEWTNGTETDQVRYYNGEEWVSDSSPESNANTRMEIVRRTDRALRYGAETQCPLSGTQLKADAQVVVLKHTPARARITSTAPNVSFYLQLGLNGTDGKWRTTTTQVFSGSWSSDEIRWSLENAFPDMSGSATDGYSVNVWRYDNRDEIEQIKWENEWRMREYERAKRWGSSSSDSGSDGGSAGVDDGYAGDSSSSSSSWSWTSTSSNSPTPPPTTYTPSWPPSSSSESSSSSSWSDDNAGYMGPQPPTLRPVPPLNFTTEIEWRSITYAPRVLAVFSADDSQVSYATTNQSLVIQVVPLDVNKFQYVPPPPSVDLSWQEEPEWMTNVRRYMPLFAANDSCNNCVKAYEACLFDLDCAYGVNDYIRDALRHNNLYWKAKTVNQTQGQERFWYYLDVSGVLRDARQFFPPKGYTKWMDLVSCWARQRCNLDYDRSIFYYSLNKALPAKPTVFANVGTEIRMVGDLGTRFELFYDGSTSYYWVSGDETVESVAKFLRDNVFKNEPTAMDEVEIAIDKVNDDVRISLRWPSRDMSRLYVVTWNWGASVKTKPAAVAIAANRTNIVDSWDALRWSRLERWLDVFSYVPSSSFPRPDYPNGTGSSNDTDDSSSLNWIHPYLPPQEPPVSTSPSSVCLACASLLQKCVSDFACANAVRAWLPKLLPAGPLSLDIYDRARWNTDVLNGVEATTESISKEYRERVLALASCLAKNGCPVGTSTKPSDWASYTFVVPTTTRFKAKRVVSLANGTSFRLSFKDLPDREVDQNAYGLGEYFDVASNWRGESVQVSRLFVDEKQRTEFTFSGSFQALRDLKITNVSSPSSVDDVVYTASFESTPPALPNWDYLLTWFGLQEAQMGAPCGQCVPKLKACYANSECWRSVHDSVLPILEQRSTVSLPWSSSYNEYTGQYAYKVELGSALYDLITNALPDVAPAFTTPTSWSLFTDILTCFASFTCDVETMDSAMEPPATTHVPSYLLVSAASAQLLLYLDSQVRIDFNGQSFDYVQVASESTEALTAALTSALAGTNITFSVGLTSSDMDNRVFNYSIVFGDAYFGRLPQFTLVSFGAVTTTTDPFATLTPWKFSIQSIDQFPEWDLVTKSLSSPPPPPATLPNMTMFECESAVAMRSACYESYECMSLLTKALPLMKHQIRTESTSVRYYEQNFEAYVGWVLHSQLFYSYSQEASSMLLDLLRESARCAAQLLPPSAPRPVFRDTHISFSLPPRSDVYISYITDASLLYQDDPSVDRIARLEQFVVENIVQPGGSNVSVVHSYRKYTYSDYEEHEFEFLRLYDVFLLKPTPTVKIFNPASGYMSTAWTQPWSLSFLSPTYEFDDAAVPWLTWLSMK